MVHTPEHTVTPRLIKAYLDKVTSPELEKIGITPSSASFLGVIRHFHGISLKELSEILLVDKAHTTRMVGKLMDLGLVVNTAEGHQYSLELTEKGNEVAIKAKEINDAASRELYKDVTPEEMEVIRNVLFKMQKVIRKEQ
jgi:DNA-binding MarR family transcriptional regulator